jgi:hypothetical protein
MNASRFVLIYTPNDVFVGKIVMLKDDGEVLSNVFRVTLSKDKITLAPVVRPEFEHPCPLTKFVFFNYDIIMRRSIPSEKVLKLLDECLDGDQETLDLDSDPEIEITEFPDSVDF